MLLICLSCRHVFTAILMMFFHKFTGIPFYTCRPTVECGVICVVLEMSVISSARYTGAWPDNDRYTRCVIDFVLHSLFNRCSWWSMGVPRYSDAYVCLCICVCVCMCVYLCVSLCVYLCVCVYIERQMSTLFVTLPSTCTALVLICRCWGSMTQTVVWAQWMRQWRCSVCGQLTTAALLHHLKETFYVTTSLSPR